MQRPKTLKQKAVEIEHHHVAADFYLNVEIEMPRRQVGSGGHEEARVPGVLKPQARPPGFAPPRGGCGHRMEPNMRRREHAPTSRHPWQDPYGRVPNIFGS